MTKNMIRIMVAALLFAACASTPVLADGTNPRPPFCPDGSSDCVN